MELEDFITLATPEGVELALPLAGLGSRIVARALDVAIRLVVALAVAVVLSAAGDLGLALLSVAVFLLLFAYDVLFEVRGRGRTPGKRLAGLRVVRSDGGPVDLQASAVRNVARLLDGLTLAYLPTVIGILATRNNQRPGDLAADTVVIRSPRARRPAVAAARAGPTAAPALDWDVSAVTADEVAVVRRFLERRDALEPEARGVLATRLTERLRPRVSSAAPDLASELFLETLLATKAARAGLLAPPDPLA